MQFISSKKIRGKRKAKQKQKAKRTKTKKGGEIEKSRETRLSDTEVRDVISIEGILKGRSILLEPVVEMSSDISSFCGSEIKEDQYLYLVTAFA